MELSKRAYRLIKAYVHRESDRINETTGNEMLQALEELNPPVAQTSSSAPAQIPENILHLARQILGVAEEARYEEILAAYKRLYLRSAPSHFPEGSEEQKIAEEIHRKVNWAFKELTQTENPVTKRFGALEIDLD